MPELPDVENIVRKIAPHILGKVFKEVAVFDSLLIQTPLSYFEENLKGKEVRGIKRRGKFILIYLEGRLVLLLHLRMTGNLIWLPKSREKHPHDRIIFLFEKGEMRFRDQRRLGQVFLLPEEELNSINLLSKLGPAPLSTDFTFKVFNSLLKRRKGKIKSVLLDQSFVAGIGNVYGDEILFQSSIKPTKKVNDLKEKEVKTLFKKVKEVLSEAVSDYENLTLKTSWFINWRRKGVCPKCYRELKKVKIGGRHSYFCPFCQR